MIFWTMFELILQILQQYDKSLGIVSSYFTFGMTSDKIVTSRCWFEFDSETTWIDLKFPDYQVLFLLQYFSADKRKRSLYKQRHWQQ